MNRLALILVVTCSIARAEAVFDERLVPLVAKFKAYAAEYGASPDWDGLIIKLEGTPKDAEGICVIGKGRREVTLDSEDWIGASEARREAVLIHELGHCLFGLEHTKSGIMSGAGLSGDEYTKHKAQYLEEFFIQGKQKKVSE